LASNAIINLKSKLSIMSTASVKSIDTEVLEDEDFLSLYLKYTAKTECPKFFHRWTSLSILAAWLGKDISLPFGHFKVYPNMYCMFIGLAGTKKSTAIKIGAELLKAAGYKHFAARKTRQEKFLIDMAEQSYKTNDTEVDILEQNLFGDSSDFYESMPPSEMYVPADEINNFIGVGNLDFMSILGELWDYEGIYDYKLKNSTDVFIPYPCINILGGNTHAGFNKLFPPEAIEQGFFSRMLFIYAEPTGIKYTIPPAKDLDLRRLLIIQLHKIKQIVRGTVSITPEAFNLLDRIYKRWVGIDDPRFEAYANRRDGHLLKLCLITMAAKLRTSIQEEDVIFANTVLTFTEHLMPKALGEFGKARNSEITHKVMQFIDAAMEPVTFHTLWKFIHKDLDKREQLAEILGNLTIADKIQAIIPEGKSIPAGYLPLKKIRDDGIKGTVDWNLLTPEELGDIQL